MEEADEEGRGRLNFPLGRILHNDFITFVPSPLPPPIPSHLSRLKSVTKFTRWIRKRSVITSLSLSFFPRSFFHSRVLPAHLFTGPRK